MTPSAQRRLVSSAAASGARPGSHSPTWVGPGALRLSGGSTRSSPVGIRLPPGTLGTPALGCGPAGGGLMGWWGARGGGGVGWSDSLGKRMGWGLLACGAQRPPSHAAPGGTPLQLSLGARCSRAQGVRHPKSFGCTDAPKALCALIPQKFWVWKYYKGAGYSDTPNVLGAEMLQGPWVQRHPKSFARGGALKALGEEMPHKFWVQRCSRDLEGRDNPKSFVCGYAPESLGVRHPKSFGSRNAPRALGSEISPKFCMRWCSSDTRCRDTPKVLHA